MIDIDRLRSCLDDAQTAEPWLRSLCVANLPAAHANFTRMADHGVTLDLLTQICEQFAAAAPAPRRSGHGAQQPGAVHRRVAQPAGHGRAVRARPGRPAQPAANLLDQPVPERPAGRRSGELRPAADDRGPARRPAGAGRGVGQRDPRARQRRRGAGIAPPVQTPRDAADRLRRHRPQPAGRNRHAADFLPGRCDRRGGPRFCPAASAGTVRPAAAVGRRAEPVRRARPRQAGRHRAELFQRHRPHLSVRAGRPDRCPPHRQQPGVLRTALEGARSPADRADRAGHRLPRRPAPAAGRRARPDLHELRQHAVVLRRERPHLGAAGVRQGPADRRRPATWAANCSSGSNRGSIAAT